MSLEPGGQLTVKAATLGFSHEPDNVVVTRGQSARLDCLVRLPATASGSHQSSAHHDESIAYDILWFQDGSPIHLPDQRRHLLTNGSLYFEKVPPPLSQFFFSPFQYYCIKDLISIW